MTEATDGTRLNQIIAVRPSVKNDVQGKVTKAYHLLQRTELHSGLARTYTPRDDDGYRYPDETTGVQVKAISLLREATNELARLFDVNAAIDWTNQEAKADIVLLGGDKPVVLVPAVPVSYLMFLEKQLVDLETMVRKLPVLPATEMWEFDPNSDVYKSQPIGTTKTQKVRKSHVLAPATDKHPAQVESYTEDEPIGTWMTTKMSGAVPGERVNQLLGRIQGLQEAVKYAREQANMTKVVDPKPGKRIMDYVFAE
jgi:hypothetical protein